MIITHSRSLALLAGLGLLSAGLAQAQTAPAAAPPAPTSSSATAEQAVVLSQFDVSAETTNGYEASETMSGSRINTKIIDLPYSTVNLTAAFFNDFNITIFDENMTYVGGLTALNIGGSFTLRGFNSSSMLRDGFYRLGRYGASNIDRIEIIRGSFAGIYGRTSPGGMVNFISKQPKQYDSQSLKIIYGGYDTQSALLELTGSIDKAQKTYYLVDLDQNTRRFDGQYDRYHNQEYYAALKHDFSDSSHLLISAEYYLQIQEAAQGAAPVMSVPVAATATNSATTKAVGLDVPLAGYNPMGPDSHLNRGNIYYEAEYDKEFNDVFSIRDGAYDFRARRWDFNNNSWGAFTIPATGAVTDSRSSVPTFGRIMEDGGGNQIDFVAQNYHIGPVRQKTLLTVDYNDYYRWDPTLNYSANTNPYITAWGSATSGRVVSLVPTVIRGTTYYVPAPGVPIAYWTQPFSTIWSQNPTTNSLTRRRTTSVGGNLSQQSFWLHDHLITFIGLRDDNVRFSQRDYTVQFNSVGIGPQPAGYGGAGQPGGSVLRRYFHEKKPDMGFNYAVDQDSQFHIYGSYSQSYFVDQTSRPAVIASSGFAPQTAWGWDYGVKGSFLNEKLNFTLGGFYALQSNVAASDEVLLSNGTYAPATNNNGDQSDKGVEFDANWLVTDNFTITASAAYINARYTQFGNEYPEVVGRAVENVAPENGSIISKYTFKDGLLRGLSVGALVTYVAPIPNQAPNSGDTTTLVPGSAGQYTVTGSTGAWDVKVPALTMVNAFVNYQLPRLPGGFYQTIGVSVNNLLNRTNYLKTSGLYGDERFFLFSYTLSHGGTH